MITQYFIIISVAGACQQFSHLACLRALIQEKYVNEICDLNTVTFLFAEFSLGSTVGSSLEKVVKVS